MDKLSGLSAINQIVGTIAKETDPNKRKKLSDNEQPKAVKSSLSLQDYIELEAKKLSQELSLSPEWLLELILRWQFGDQMMNEPKAQEMLQYIMSSVKGTSFEGELKDMVRQLSTTE
jgi:hypothetical protein